MIRDHIHREGLEHKASTLLKGVIRETLRLYPVAPFVGRFMDEDTVIGNYKIHANVSCLSSFIHIHRLFSFIQSMVLTSLFTAGRDEANFRDANTFCPLRWDRNADEYKTTINPQATMPYALGARSCVGQRVANAQMRIFLGEVRMVKHSK